MAILAALLFEWATRKDSSGARPLRLGPLLSSAAALGLAAAGKYPYALVGLAILPFLVFHLRRRWPLLLLYGGLALVVFLLANPFLWPNPPARLWEAFSFHWHYAHSGQVAELAWPWWRQFYYLTASLPSEWHSGLFPTRLADELLVPLAVLGLPWALRRRPIWVAWAVVGLAFLLAWPTKWPQYTLLVRPALAVVGGIGLVEVGRMWGRSMAEVVGWGWRRKNKETTSPQSPVPGRQ